MFAIIDVYSRRIVGWSISNTMNTEWCRETLSDAIRTEGKPEIFNRAGGPDRSRQSIYKPGFIHPLLEKGIKISMDGKGKALDNVFRGRPAIERFWRSLKQEYVYLNPRNGGMDLYRGIKAYVEFYNRRRKHTGTGYIPNVLFLKPTPKHPN